ncbi:MAG: hypothetical protein RL276_1414, partial [Bacteroidota bacterium]
TWFRAQITLRAAQGTDAAWLLPIELVSVDQGAKAKPEFFIVNGAERLPLAYVGANAEGYERYELPYFPGELWWRKEGSTWNGFWVRPDRGERYGLRLERGPLPRFDLPEGRGPREVLAARYGLKMHHPDQPADQGSNAIAVLEEQADGRVFGTIMTESGDYRYLAGNRYHNHVYLSTFNGVFAYVFALELGPDGRIEGTQFLSPTRQQRISGAADPDARLADPTSLSSMKPGVESLTFSLPHYQTGELFRPEPGKPAVIQIMGSWCPNCVDESNAFAQFQKAYPDVQFFGITFERSADREQAFPAVDKFVRGLDLRYPILFGGRAERGAVERTLEGLANFHSYPTTIYLDKQGKVRKIYSGFYGPGTPEYAPWLEETRAFIDKLRAE